MYTAPTVWVLTGGIGSGKSTVARLLRERGISVIDADRIGHDVLRLGEDGFEPVASRWPEVVRDGGIDRRSLAKIVFNDAGELAALEAILHPLILDRLRLEMRSAGEGLVVCEVSVPKVVSREAWPVAVVTTPPDVRAARLVARGMDEADIRARMSVQAGDEGLLGIADHVIDNGGDLDSLEAQVDALVVRMRTGLGSPEDGKTTGGPEDVPRRSHDDVGEADHE